MNTMKLEYETSERGCLYTVKYGYFLYCDGSVAGVYVLTIESDAGVIYSDASYASLLFGMELDTSSNNTITQTLYENLINWFHSRYQPEIESIGGYGDDFRQKDFVRYDL